MKRKVTRGFLDAYKGDVDGSYLVAPDSTSGRPGMHLATDRDGNPVLVKQWPLAGRKERSVLLEIWRHELRQLHRLAGYPGAEEYVSTLVDAGSDQHGFYLVLAAGQRQPLDVAVRRAPPGHWLKTPRKNSSRIRAWRNLSRLAKGLETLHAQGMLHRNLDTWAVLTAGGQQPDFLLTGFEWSMRLIASTADPTSDRGASRSKGVFDSFARDWSQFGLLATTLLGVSADRVGNPAIPPHEIAEHLLAEEGRVLRDLARADQQARMDGETVCGYIDNILSVLAAEAANLEPKLHLSFRLGATQRLSAQVRQASSNEIEVDDIEAQLQFIRADLSDTPLLLAVRSQPGSEDFRLVLRGHNLLYSLGEYRQPGSPTPSWEFAACERAEERAPAQVNLLGQRVLDTSSLEAMSSVDAAKRYPRLRGKLRDWADVKRSLQEEHEPKSPERKVRDALALSSVIEALNAAADIFPVTVQGIAAEGGATVLRLSVRNDPDRAELVESLGLRPNAVRLAAILTEDRAADDAVQREGWRLTENGSLGQKSPSDTLWRFVRVDRPSDADAEYVFLGDSPTPLEQSAFLVQGGSVGRDVQFRRRLKALAALAKHAELSRMLADPRGRILDSHDAVAEDDPFKELDAPKQTALRELTGTLPFYMVQGPPGVGKTRLVRDLVFRRFADDRTSRLLLSAQSNAALDHLLEELGDMISGSGDAAPMVVRCRGPETGSTDGPFDVVPLARDILLRLRASPLAAEARPQLKAKLDLLAGGPRRRGGRSGSGGSASDQAREFTLRAFEGAVVRAANVVFATTNSGELERLIEERSQFDWAIIEEAGKATGGELLSPMLLSHRRLMIGDHKQLPPYGSDQMLKLLASPENVRKSLEAGRDYLGRWLRDETTEEILDDIEADSEGEDLPALCGLAARTLTYFETAIEDEFRRQARLRGGRPIATRLTEQHRMHPALADLVSVSFYEGRLATADRCTAKFASEAPPHSTLDAGRLPLAPVTVVEMPYLQSTIGKIQGDLQPRWHNPEEVSAVQSVLELLKAVPSDKPPRLAVLSPYVQQVKRLSSMISDAANGTLAHLSGFRPALPGYCGTVDSFQGNEAEVVVVSLVRNNDHATPLAALGFLSDPRRMNVLLSRAKWQMVLVGSIEFLEAVVGAPQLPEDAEKVLFLGKMLAWLRKPPSKFAGHVRLVPYARLMGKQQ